MNRKREIESINDKNLKLLNTLKNTKANIRPSEFREHERRCMQLKQNISTTHYSPAPDKALPSIRPVYQSFHSGATPYSNLPVAPQRPTSVGTGRRTQSQDMLRPFSAEGTERPFTSGQRFRSGDRRERPEAEASSAGLTGLLPSAAAELEKIKEEDQRQSETIHNEPSSESKEPLGPVGANHEFEPPFEDPES